MGIDYSSAVLLAKARNNNVCFNKIITIGHLKLYLTKIEIVNIAKRYNVEIDESVFLENQYANRYLESFLDAKSIVSLDYSGYEDCDIIHDMNYPIDSSYHEQFDVVIDGGSLEHIFNFPVAIANCMKMVKKGGSLFIFTAANNYLGHGFYQFSPELFFRILQPTNGYEIRDVILVQHPFPSVFLSSKLQYFSVVDPILVQERVGLVSKSPVIIMVHATRTEIKSILGDYPIQSDYVLRYDEKHNGEYDQKDNGSTYASLKILVSKVIKILPQPLKKLVVGNLQLLLYSFANRRVYKRWHPF